MKSQHSLRVTKHIRRSRETVFAAWTDPTIMRRWFCPKEMTLAESEADVRVGGRFRAVMKTESITATAQGTYREVVPNEKIVFTHSWAEADGPETLVTVLFVEKDGGTEITLTQEGLPSEKEAKSHESGWSSTLDNFAEHAF